MNKLVSILIPLYNSEKYIAETLESCLKQTYNNLEIIIVDDGSTDNSLKIAKKYAKKYESIKLYTQKNAGAQRARNLAFEKSSGEYIQYLDADDLLSENKIYDQMNLVMRHGDNNIYSCKFIRFTKKIKDGKYFEKNIDKTFDNSIDWLITSWSNGGMGQTSIWLTPRKIIEKSGLWDETLIKNQDGEFFNRVLLNSEKVIYSDNAIVYYRFTGSSSISFQMTEKSAKATLYSYHLYRNNCKIIDNKVLDKAIAYCYLSFINHYYPNYPNLLKEAEDSIYSLGYSFSSLEIDSLFGKISQIIGFKNTLRLRYISRLITKGIRT